MVKLNQHASAKCHTHIQFHKRQWTFIWNFTVGSDCLQMLILLVNSHSTSIVQGFWDRDHLPSGLREIGGNVSFPQLWPSPSPSLSLPLLSSHYRGKATDIYLTQKLCHLIAYTLVSCTKMVPLLQDKVFSGALPGGWRWVASHHLHLILCIQYLL